MKTLIILGITAILSTSSIAVIDNWSVINQQLNSTSTLISANLQLDKQIETELKYTAALNKKFDYKK